MTMQEPRTGIIFLECDCEVAVCGQCRNVASRGVDEVESASRDVEDAGGLANDPEIMAVEMDWVVETVGELLEACFQIRESSTYPIPVSSWMTYTTHSSSASAF